jgi:hypothetical protein
MIKLILFSLLLIGGCLVAAPLSTQAAAAPAPKATNLLGPGSDCSGSNGTGSSAVCTDTSNADKNTADNPVSNKLRNITNIIAYVGGAAAILIILVASIQYITSDGDSNKISNAKTTIIYAAIGIAVIVLAVSIIEFVLNKL